MIDFTRFRFYLSSLIFLKLFDFFLFSQIVEMGRTRNALRRAEQKRELEKTTIHQEVTVSSSW